MTPNTAFIYVHYFIYTCVCTCVYVYVYMLKLIGMYIFIIISQVETTITTGLCHVLPFALTIMRFGGKENERKK